MKIDEIEYPADGICPVCGSDVEYDPEADYGCAGIRYIGWVCTGDDCDAGQVVAVGTWRSDI
ncbi:hypothetical protein D2T81_00790 [Azospirillum brasilense]|nr:hypothetical protein D2T81_00790 [Azospirillum brasilense]